MILTPENILKGVSVLWDGDFSAAAQAIDCHRSALWRWARGERTPGTRSAGAIKRAFEKRAAEKIATFQRFT